MKEQERKFILEYLPIGLTTPLNLKQGYLMLDGKRQLRVRIVNNEQAFICYKISQTDILRDEFEYEIPIKDGLELYVSAEFSLEKLRYKTTFENNQIDIDVYPNGLSIVEIEYENEPLIFPDYFGKEITGIREYSNIYLATTEKWK